VFRFLVSWQVEEVDNDSGALLSRRSFDSYDEALDRYYYLKEQNTSSIVRIEKTEKKLLQE
jgi:hypothetical protein